ncbi:MAG: hypothetical protein Ct9H300mP28_26510 [Pseudomonadota bacterium]|nr:MAG: hypothetical protein Ct9H300mP28_26510 [Pseudomonadota bacterium]
MIKDIPGMVLTRTVAMLVNEASMLGEEKVADQQTLIGHEKRSQLSAWIVGVG